MVDLSHESKIWCEDCILKGKQPRLLFKDANINLVLKKYVSCT